MRSQGYEIKRGNAAALPLFLSIFLPSITSEIHIPTCWDWITQGKAWIKYKTIATIRVAWKSCTYIWKLWSSKTSLYRINVIFLKCSGVRCVLLIRIVVIDNNEGIIICWWSVSYICIFLCGSRGFFHSLNRVFIEKFIAIKCNRIERRISWISLESST